MRRALPTIAALVGVVSLVALLGGGVGGAPPRASGATAETIPTAADRFQPQLGLPATRVVAFGASPGEAPGETWAYGVLGSAPAIVDGRPYSEQYALLQRTEASPAWKVLPLPQTPEDKGGPGAYGALAGQATEAGGVVLLSGQSIVVRDPGAQPRLVPAPAPALEAGESLLPPNPAQVPYAAIE
ncbi:MAG: hypothetical protein FWD42_09150, partial [Solirubrobacterales bacterium]|nr:hypothetical protein [Solirubrobacterales bacterium]